MPGGEATTIIGTVRPIGDLLREWRQRRRMSQLDLACEAAISTKHLSFLETGRSRPSRDMVLLLADRLGLPLRNQNILLHAAGYGPAYRERALDDPDMRVARQGVDALLASHDPNPGIAIDRHWSVTGWNNGMMNLMAGVEPMLLRPPTNLLRLTLHPAGLAPRIANLPAWRGHLVQRLRRQIDATGDTVLIDMLEELLDYPMARGPTEDDAPSEADSVAIPLRLITIDGLLTFYVTTMSFGSPRDVTLSEMAVELYHPANDETACIMRQVADGTIMRPMVPLLEAG